MSTREDVKLSVKKPLTGRGQKHDDKHGHPLMAEIFEDSEV